MPAWPQEAEEDQEEFREQDSSRGHQEALGRSQGEPSSRQREAKASQGKRLGKLYLHVHKSRWVQPTLQVLSQPRDRRQDLLEPLQGPDVAVAGRRLRK